MDSISIAEVQKMLDDRASQMWIENQKYMSSEVGFVTLSKDEVKIQVEEIMEKLIKIRSGKE